MNRLLVVLLTIAALASMAAGAALIAADQVSVQVGIGTGFSIAGAGGWLILTSATS